MKFPFGPMGNNKMERIPVTVSNQTIRYITTVVFFVSAMTEVNEILGFPVTRVEGVILIKTLRVLMGLSAIYKPLPLIGILTEIK